MTHEEKVKFLFAQTCTVISNAVSNDGGRISVPLAIKTSRLFDEVYEVLEKKLEEKLPNQ
jgi:hypothetical protein